MGVSGANTNGKFPSLGAIVDREIGARKSGMPAYVAAPHASSVGLVPGYFGGNFLGATHDPFQTGGDPNGANFQVSNLNLVPGLNIAQLEDRRRLSARFDEMTRTTESAATQGAMDRFGQEAFEFISGPTARRAFDIALEDPRLRDRYGRHGWGQSCLLKGAGWLVEAGSTFVAVHFGGWDHHWDLKKGYETNLPIVDAAVASLFEDLDDRGLLEKTLVVLCGEFSRTPKMNDGGNGGPAGSMGTPGRDHWGDAMFCLMGGGGVKGGQIIGSTDKQGTRPTSRPSVNAVEHSRDHLSRTARHRPDRLQLTDPTGRSDAGS